MHKEANILIRKGDSGIIIERDNSIELLKEVKSVYCAKQEGGWLEVVIDTVRVSTPFNVNGEPFEGSPIEFVKLFDK